MTSFLLNSFLAFLAGVMLNFTPCVLPVVPLKIQAVLHEISGHIHSRLMAAAFLLAGTLSFFLILGACTAYLGLTWGAFFQSKVFLAVLSILLFFSAVTTLAGWSLRLPQIVYRVPNQRYMGAFLTGVLAGILSTPCSGPFLGSVLAYAVTRTPGIILAIFVSIGAGLASPYVVILVWPGLLGRFSYARPWANQVKHILGFVLLAGAVFFGRVLIPEFLHAIMWGILCVAVVIWALFMLKRSQSWPERVFPIIAVATVMLVISPNVSTRAECELEWREFEQKTLKIALSAHRPVLLEFTADWCLNCKVLEKTVYADKGVVRAANHVRVIPCRIDMTDFDEKQKALLRRYGGTALPYVILIDGNGKVINRFAGMFSAKTLEEAILQLEVDREMTKAIL